MDDNKDDLSMLDKVIQNNPFIKPGQAQYENVQTQSVVKSTREEAQDQLAAINAQQAEYLRQQKMAEDAARAKRIAAYIGVGVLFAILLIVAGWVMIGAIVASMQGGVKPTVEVTADDSTKYEKVEGFKCSSDKCYKIADIDKEKIIMRDASEYFIFNKTSKEKTLTTIASNEYHAIDVFKWGNNYLAVLDPESGQSALYNITANRQITEFSYDEFYTDIKSATYTEMAWVEQSYIIARSGSSRRLIDLSSGSEKVRANKKVFVYDKYFFGYETDGSIHIYDSNSAQILVVNEGGNIFVKDSFVVVYTADGSMEVYNASGETDSDSAVAKELNQLSSDERLKHMQNDKSFYHISENK